MLVASSNLILTHTVSVPEVIWTALCSVGLFYSARLFRKSVGDLAFLKDGGINHAREYSATTTVWIFGGMAINQFVYVLIGVAALMLPSPNDVIRPLTFIMTAAFVMSSAIQCMLAYVIEARKEHLIQMLIENEKLRTTEKVVKASNTANKVKAKPATKKAGKKES